MSGWMCDHCEEVSQSSNFVSIPEQCVSDYHELCNVCITVSPKGCVACEEGKDRMIDADKYEGHSEAPWYVGHNPQTNNWIVCYPIDGLPTYGRDGEPCTVCDVIQNRKDAQLIADAPDLLAEVKRLRRAWQILRSRTEMSCVCFTEYPDNQDINTHELMDLAMKEAIE